MTSWNMYDENDNGINSDNNLIIDDNYLIYANSNAVSSNNYNNNVNNDNVNSAKVCNETDHSNDNICDTYDATWCVERVNVTLVSKSSLKYGLTQFYSKNNIHCK